jgi:hypothetical protein
MATSLENTYQTEMTNLDDTTEVDNDEVIWDAQAQRICAEGCENR